MMKIILALLFIGNSAVLSAQHWEGLDGGTEPMGVVFSMFEYDNNLIVGGSFSSVGGGTIPSIINGIWNGSGWSSSVWNIEQGSQKDNVFFNNALHIGGNFKSINGNTYCNKVARLDTSGWVPLGSGITNGEVRAMASFNGDLYVGGTFTIVDSTITANRIARWDGSSWNAVGSGIPGGFGVYDMEVFQSELYVAGYFSTLNGVSTPGVARFDGTSWNSLSSGTNGPVLAMFHDSISNRLYIGGQFTIAGGVSTPTGVAYWDGTDWFAVGSGPYIPAWDLIIFKGILYNASSQSQAVNTFGDTIKYMAWFDGLNWNPVPGGLDATGNCLTIFLNEFYIGGHFTYAGDSLVNGIAKWIPGSLGGGEISEDKLVMKIMPNPAKDEVILEINVKKPMKLKLKVTDANGNTIFNELLSGSGTLNHRINTSGYTSGIYMFSVYEGKKLLGSEKVVIQK